MNSKIVEDREVADFFIGACSETLLSFLQELHSALKKYSENPEIIPPRIVGTIPSGSTVHLYMPVIDDVYSGVKTLGYNASSNMGFVGSINVTDAESGMLYGTLQAKELTGVRTALVSCIGLYHQLDKFENLGAINCTVFGSGLQAFWHVLFCARLLSGKCKQLNVCFVNRSSKIDLEPIRTILNRDDTNMELSFTLVKLSEKLAVKKVVANSHIIFGCAPSEAANIHYTDLAEVETIVPHTYISLIGSYKPHMHECDAKLISEFQKQKVPILVDSKEHTLLEAGELIDSNVTPQQLQEIGRLEKDKLQTIRCEKNNRTITLCKIVGLSIMDICVAKKLLEVSKLD